MIGIITLLCFLCGVAAGMFYMMTKILEKLDEIIENGEEKESDE